jgi:hypothetical protein
VLQRFLALWRLASPYKLGGLGFRASARKTSEKRSRLRKEGAVTHSFYLRLDTGRAPVSSCIVFPGLFFPRTGR